MESIDQRVVDLTINAVRRELKQTHMASKSYVKATISEYPGWKDHAKRIQSLERQVKKLFALSTGSGESTKYITPRKGQLCYAWYTHWEDRTAVFFERFNDGYFVDSTGIQWNNWRPIPVDDVR